MTFSRLCDYVKESLGVLVGCDVRHPRPPATLVTDHQFRSVRDSSKGQGVRGPDYSAEVFIPSHKNRKPANLAPPKLTLVRSFRAAVLSCGTKAKMTSAPKNARHLLVSTRD